MRNRVGIGLLCVALAGCARGPRVEVAHSGTIPAGGAYLMVESDNRPDAPWAALLRERLGGLGFTTGEDGRYVVQASRAERGRRVGLVIGAPAPDAPPQRRPRGRVLSTLDLSISDAASGAELYRATATRAARAEAGPEDWAELLGLALAPPEETAP